jgi:hypothetical protein
MGERDHIGRQRMNVGFPPSCTASPGEMLGFSLGSSRRRSCAIGRSPNASCAQGNHWACAGVPKIKARVGRTMARIECVFLCSIRNAQHCGRVASNRTHRSTDQDGLLAQHVVPKRPVVPQGLARGPLLNGSLIRATCPFGICCSVFGRRTHVGRIGSGRTGV